MHATRLVAIRPTRPAAFSQFKCQVSLSSKESAVRASRPIVDRRSFSWHSALWVPRERPSSSTPDPKSSTEKKPSASSPKSSPLSPPAAFTTRHTLPKDLPAPAFTDTQLSRDLKGWTGPIHVTKPAPPPQQPLPSPSSGRSLSGSSTPSGDDRSVNREIRALFILNAVILGAWFYSGVKKKPELQQQLFQHFVLTRNNLEQGRWWVMLTSAFSHQDIFHFAFNMFALSTFGSILAGVAGVRALPVLLLYCGSAIAGSAAWLYHLDIKTKAQAAARKKTIWEYVGGDGRPRIIEAALGASGATMGMSAAATCLSPFSKLRLLFIPIPIPLWLFTIGYFAVDAYFLDSTTSKIGHSAHLGGAVFGVLFTLLGPFRKLGAIGRIWRRR